MKIKLRSGYEFEIEDVMVVVEWLTLILGVVLLPLIGPRITVANIIP